MFMQPQSRRRPAFSCSIAPSSENNYSRIHPPHCLMEARTVNVELDLDEGDVDLIDQLLAQHHFKSRSAVVRYAIGL